MRKTDLMKSNLKSTQLTCLCRRWLPFLTILLIAFTSGFAQKPTEPQGKSRFTSLDHIRIHYETYGEGRAALVLIHGWSCNVDYWRNQIPDFAKQRRVIAIDLPGHGKSDKPEIAYTMDLFARAVDAVLRDAGVERAVL